MHFFHKSCRLASSWAAMRSGGALGRYLGRLLDYVMIFWTSFGTVFCGYHLFGDDDATIMTNFWNIFLDLTLNELWTRVSSGSITMHFLSWKLSSGLKLGSNTFWGAVGRYLGRLLDFGLTFWTISGTVFCGNHLFWDDDATFGTNFWNIFLELTLNELWTRVSSRSITMHFLSWKLSSGLKSGSNAFWGALEGLAPPLSMTSPVLFALALTSLSLKMA